MMIVLTIFYTILPFSRPFMLSGIPIPLLRLFVSPPGYPVSGKSWEMETWGSLDNGLTWKPVENITIEIISSRMGTFITHSDEQGKSFFTYRSEIGDVMIVASDSTYGNSSFRPQVRFVSSEVGRFVVSFFGVGTPSIVLLVLRRLKRKNTLNMILFCSLLVFLSIGWLLSLIWFVQWKLGSEWGFGNAILNWDYPVLFDPHLFVIMLIVMVLTPLASIRAAGFAEKKRESYVAS